MLKTAGDIRIEIAHLFILAQIARQKKLAEQKQLSDRGNQQAAVKQKS